jgi:hypothetical protein
MSVALDADVRAEIDRLCKECVCKVVINEAMRRGLDKMEAELKLRPPPNKG